MRSNLQRFRSGLGRARSSGLFHVVFSWAVIIISGGGTAFVRGGLGIAYLILWTLLLLATARWRKPGILSEFDEKQKIPMLFLGIFSVPFLLIAPAYEYAHFSGPLPRNGWLAWLGIFLFAGGVLVQAAAMRELRGFYTVRLGIQPTQRVITSGLYRWLRHPGYLSYLMCLFGIGLAMGSLIELAFAAAMIFFTLWRIGHEETMLLASFGDEYRNYQQKTRRLIPFLY